MFVSTLGEGVVVRWGGGLKIGKKSGQILHSVLLLLAIIFGPFFITLGNFGQLSATIGRLTQSRSLESILVIWNFVTVFGSFWPSFVSFLGMDNHFMVVISTKLQKKSFWNIHVKKSEIISHDSFHNYWTNIAHNKIASDDVRVVWTSLVVEQALSLDKGQWEVTPQATNKQPSLIFRNAKQESVFIGLTPHPPIYTPHKD